MTSPALAATAPHYRCPVCDVRWPYAAVRNVACCPACGGGLLRDEPSRPAAERPA